MRPEVSLLRRRVVLALGAMTVARLAPAQDGDIETRRTGGPYVPTPQIVVDEMLRIGRVGAGDFVVDLGSGDGVIVLTAALKHKARGFGVDIDPELVAQSNKQAKKLGIADRAAFHVQDVFKADIGRATVVTLYLLPNMMLDLRPKILAEAAPGTRVVSHDYHFGEWPPDDQYTWDVPEKEKVNGVPRATVYLWYVPARVQGRWRLQLAAPASEKYDLTLRQNFQNLNGTVAGGGRTVKLTQSRLAGSEISFAFPAGGDRHLFKGRVDGDAMEGTVELARGRGSARWTAIRQKS